MHPCPPPLPKDQRPGTASPTRPGVTALLATVTVTLALAGCATTSTPDARHPQDPFEGYNRAMTTFNDTVDRALLTPAATAYQAITPQPVQTGVSNFFANAGDLWSLFNHLLQGHAEKAYNHLVRFSTNTVFGLGGLIDIATPAGIPREKQDFGQTLAHWGVAPGPYLVLPLLGPSTLRDTVALPLDWNGHPLGHLHPVRHRNALTGLHFIERRAALLGATNTLQSIALDPYSLTRDFYLRQRDPARYATSPQDTAHASDGQVESYDD